MLSAALKSPGRWNPKRLGPTLALWLDPSDIATMFQLIAGTTAVTDTSVCGFLGDKSGNGFNLTSIADDTTRPTWNFNSGLPYINGDGSNDIVRRTSSLGMYAAGACSVFCAVRGNSPATSAQLVCEQNSGNTTQRYVPLRTLAATASTNSPFIRNDANSILLADAAVTQVNSFVATDTVVGSVDNGTTVTLYLDGVAGTPVGYTRSGVLTIDRFSFLGRNDSTPTSSFFAGRAYGLVVVNRAITGPEAASLTTYLAAKQGRVL